MEEEGSLAYDPTRAQKLFRKRLTYYRNFVTKLPKKSKRVPRFCFSNENCNKLKPSQKLVYDFFVANIRKTGTLIGCLSAGGYGKSYLLKCIQSKLDLNQLPYATISYTAISAAACHGQTAHSFLKLNYSHTGGLKYLTTQPLPEGFRDEVQKLKFLLVDEIGFINSDFFSFIDSQLKRARQNKLDFGGLSVLVFGDFGQLPPFCPPELYTDREDLDDHVKKGRDLFRKFKLFNLTENVRVSDDETFQSILTNFRHRKVTQKDIDILNSRRLSLLEEEEKASFKDVLHIYPRNALVNSYNNKKLKELGNPIVTLKPSTRILGTEIPEEFTILLADQALVTLTRNLNFPSRLIHGSRGVVEAILFDGAQLPAIVFVHFASYVGPICESIGEKKLVPIVPIYEKYFSKALHRYINIKVFPLRLAYACSVHGAQSQTIKKFAIYFDSREYFLSQSYTALSRGTELASVAVLDGELTLSRFKNESSDRQYKRFLEQLHKLNINFEMSENEIV